MAHWEGGQGRMLAGEGIKVVHVCRLTLAVERTGCVLRRHGTRKWGPSPCSLKESPVWQHSTRK